MAEPTETETETVLGLLQENARFSIEDIARQTELPPETVGAAIDELEQTGVVRGYTPVVDPERRETERVRAVIELNVTLDRETSYGDIADRLAKFPAVESLELVSGEFDFMMTVEDDSMRAVSGFVSERVAPVPEITQTVTHYAMQTYKRSGIVMDDSDEDDRLSVTP